MSDIHPDALSLEDAGTTIDTPPTAQPAGDTAPDDTAEPEGVVEHQGKRMVDVSVLAAERRRVREATERAIREKELTPLQAKAQEADQLRAALNEVRPILDHVRQHGLPKAPEPPSGIERIPDDRAERYARRFELYDKSGQPDVARAKAILAEQQADIESAAQAAAQAAVGPITSQTAQQASKDNFVRMAMARDANQQPLVDAKELSAMWVSLPPELTAHPEVADLVLNAAIGKSIRSGKAPVTRSERGPIISEPAGGRSGPSYQMDHMAKQLARHAGMSDKQFQEAGKGYQPGAVNVLGD